jgi:peptidyl-tRNA hydrolase
MPKSNTISIAKDQKPKKDQVLYILMRTDLASMNPGKAVAQGAHAANQFVADYWASAIHNYWRNEADGQGFGTTIVLGVNEAQLLAAIEAAKALGVAANITHDPTYPIRDGEVTHLIPLNTCGYVFGTRAEIFPIVRHLELMK